MSFFSKDVLAPEHRKYNLQKQPEDKRDIPLKSVLGWTMSQWKLPPKRSLRGLLFNPPIYNQGVLGSCSANATGFAYQYESKKQRLLFSSAPSRLFIYYNSRLIEWTTDADTGSHMRNSIKALAKYGVIPESEYPYDPSAFALKPSDANYRNALANTIDWYYSVAKSEHAIKQAIYQRFPVVFGMSIYGAINYVTKDKPILSMSTSEWLLGWHALVIVGYDDTKRLYLVRNSWGDGWADGGYFYVPYAYIEMYGFDFWVISKI